MDSAEVDPCAPTTTLVARTPRNPSTLDIDSRNAKYSIYLSICSKPCPVAKACASNGKGCLQTYFKFNGIYFLPFLSFFFAFFAAASSAALRSSSLRRSARRFFSSISSCMRMMRCCSNWRRSSARMLRRSSSHLLCSLLFVSAYISTTKTVSSETPPHSATQTRHSLPP
jgi:hypothetical protein